MDMHLNKLTKNIRKKANAAKKLTFFHDVRDGLDVKCIDRRTHEVRRIMLPRDKMHLVNPTGVLATLGL